MFTIDVNSAIPLYEQLQNQIIEYSLVGLLKSGDSLPSVRMMAKQLGINPNTVAKAYTELEHQNVITTIPGKGTFFIVNKEMENKYIQNSFQSLQAILSKLKQLKVPQTDIQSIINDIYTEEENV